MTNKEWLDYLAHNAPDELAAWFDAEHVETPNGTLQSDTAALEAKSSDDSREKLEADVYRAADEMDRFYCGEKFIDTRKIIGWLDRQAAITERECRKPNWSYCETCEALEKLTAERERYRDKFSKCLDYADAIHALMDDEGMA